MTEAAGRDACRAVGRHLGAATTGARGLGGAATAVTLAYGRTVVAKRGAGPGAAHAEAAGLRWLAESGDVPVPRVHGDDAIDGGWLVVDHIPMGSPDTAAAEALGRGLAALHARSAPAFGSAPPGGPADAWIGLAPMANREYDDWPAFYAELRVEPYVRAAVDRGVFSSTDAAVFDAVCGALPDLAGPPESVARVHGDLWNGNVHWGADGRAWLIDPAAHGGHRETDLAMLELFGAPLLSHLFGAYAQQVRGRRSAPRPGP